VVDLGVGYGEAAVFLKSVSPDVKYLGVEAQPVIYECVSNTFRELNEDFRASPFVLSTETDIKFVSQGSYASVGAIPEGYIEIPTLSWPEFIKRYNLNRIDLLKMNIEGAEKQLIESIDDFSIIKRFIISCHDFRANNGEGEFYRTKKDVMSKLQENGYKIRTFDYGTIWSDDWIFASKDI
jgi:FkbM family methyltransferase